jgi:hypothetical protein
MGVVYRALDPLLGRYVAIKVMSQGIATDQELRNRFMREARAAGSLQHPNIITIFDFGEADGLLYIAMEYVEGADLSEIMERRDPLPITAKVDIIVDVLHALDYAHQRKVVHRDVKPANIRVSVDGRAKLMDFGIARLEKSDLTRSGMMIGTPDYMAPEQITGGEITPATDVFAVGAVLYEFLTGRPTFQGETLHALIYQVINQQPAPLREVSASVPAALQPIVDRALAKDPAERYPSAAAMAEALSSVRTALSGAVTVAIAARRTPLQTPRIAPPVDVREGRRRRPLVLAGAGAGVVALGAAAVLLLSGHPRQSAAPGPTPTNPAGQAAAPADTTAEPERAPTRSAPATARPQGQARPPAGGGAPPATASRGSTASVPSAAAPQLAVRAVSPTPSARENARPAASATQAAIPPSEPAAGATPQLPAAAAPEPQQAAPAPSSPAAVPTSPSAAIASPPPAADPRPQIEALVADYARAIEARSVTEIRRVYPSLTSAQQKDWEQFFRAARSVKAQLAISQLDLRGDAADLAVTGRLDFDAGGGTQHQPMSFRATAARLGGVWRLTVVR